MPGTSAAGSTRSGAGVADAVRTTPTGLQPVLQVHPLTRCNLACQHCYTASGPQASQALSLRRLTGCVDDAHALGYRQLAVSGGEPLLWPGLTDLLRQARALGWTTTLTTNGLLVDPVRWAAIAPHLDLAAVSIDGTPEAHDALRGRPGAHAATVARLAVLRAAGTPFGFITTLTQHNLDGLEAVVRLAAEQGARSVQVHPLGLQGRAATTDALADARPDGHELMAALVECRRLEAEHGVAVHLDALAFEQLEPWRDRLVPRLPVRRLAAVAPLLVVNPDGQVLPLTHEIAPRLALGNLREAPLAALAATWLARGRAERLVRACETAWHDLRARGAGRHAGERATIELHAHVEGDGGLPVDWFEEVARHSHRQAEGEEASDLDWAAARLQGLWPAADRAPWAAARAAVAMRPVGRLAQALQA